MKITFDDMCREVLQCKNYIEWEHEEVIYDGTKRYVSEITCVSCTEVGQSFNIEEYPANCPHKEALDRYTKKRKAAHKRFLIKCEKEDMWEKLNNVTS